MGTITLAAPDPSGGITIALKSSLTTVATVPPIITVAAGQTTASFPISTNVVATDSPRIYIADVWYVYPHEYAGPATASCHCFALPNLVIGGASETAWVLLNDSAAFGGVVVSLSSNNSAASVPTTVSTFGTGFGSPAAQGIFLNPNGEMSSVNANIVGRFFGGDSQDMQIVSGTNLIAPPPGGGSTGGSTGGTIVPEPSSIVLLLTVLAGLGLGARRKALASAERP